MTYKKEQVGIEHMVTLSAEELTRLVNERDAWKDRAEAAQKDIELMLEGGSSCCDLCANFNKCVNGYDFCEPVWRGPAHTESTTPNESEEDK